MRRDLNFLGFNFWCLFNRLPTQYILATHTYWKQTSYWQHIQIGNKLATGNIYLFAPIGNTYIFAPIGNA